MNEQQDQTRSFVQAKLTDFSNRVSQGYHKPVRSFFKDMLMGICGTGEPSLHNVAKFFQDNTSTKQTSESKYRKGFCQGKDFYLLCDFGDPNMTEKELIARAIDTYKRRWPWKKCIVR